MPYTNSSRGARVKLRQKSQKTPSSSKNKSTKRAGIKKLSKIKLLLIVAFVTVFGAIGTITLLKSSAYTGNAWWYMPRVAACESGGITFGTKNYTIVNSYGYAGAYQFGYPTWKSVSKYIPAGSAHHQYDNTRPQYAPPAEQDYRFQVLWNHGGSGPWTASQACWKPYGTLRGAPNQTPGTCATAYVRCTNLPDTSWNGTSTTTTTSSGGGSTTTTQTASPTAFMFGDVNGGGYDEMIGLASNGNLSMYLNNNDGYSSGTTIGSGFQTYGGGMFSADINGDGRSDLLGMDASSNIYLYTSNGSTSTPYSGSRQLLISGAGLTNKILFDDVTGDRYADMVLVDTSGNIYLYPNSGGTFGARRTIGTGALLDAQYLLGDLNADNYADLVTIEPGGGLYQYINTRNSTSPYASKQQIGSGWGGYSRVLLGDVNGDGYADALGVTSTGDVYAYFNSRSTTTPYNPRSLIATGVTLFL